MTTIYGNCYEDTWREEQNEKARRLLRDHLHNLHEATIVVFQPGDGTRYRFLLLPEPTEIVVSDGGREVSTIEHYRNPSLLVTVLNGLGSGVATVSRKNGLDGILHRIQEGIKFRNDNQCTIEALAHTIHAVWSDEGAA